MSILKRMKTRLGLSAKASAAAGLGTRGGAVWLDAGRPRWGGRGYERLAREGYIANVIAHRAVRLVAECAADAPLALERDGRRIEGHPLLDLLARPQGPAGGPGLFERAYAYLLLAGNAYIERVDGPGGGPVGGPGGGQAAALPLELHALRPDRMTVKPGPKGWPEAYDYAAGGQRHRFAVDAVHGRSPILHLKSFHPLDDQYGLGALAPAAMGIDIHNAAADWNKALLDNAARPSGALVYAPGEGVAAALSEDQRDRLKAELEALYQGAGNAGRPFLLEGGLSWQPMALSPADMEFLAAKHAAARDIALAFGVPPMLLGIPGDNTYANYQEANRALWRLTVLPLVDRVTAALAAWLLPDAPGLTLKADRDKVTALAAERDAVWARVGAAGFLTVNEKRAALGYPPVENGDRLADRFSAPPRAGPVTPGAPSSPRQPGRPRRTRPPF